MKKNFSLIVDNKSLDRQVDSIKYEVKKYISRERRKKLPEGADYWDFDCRIGKDKGTASGVHISKINEQISKVSEDKHKSFYLEILAKTAKRSKKPH